MRAAAVARAAAAAIALAASALSGCSYGPPTTHHQVMNAMGQPHDRNFAAIVLSTTWRMPQGLSKWPDGGRPRLLGQIAKLYFCNPATGGVRLMSIIPRPATIRSEYSAWIVAWDSAGFTPSLYLDVRGRAGETSDTKMERYLLRVEVDPDTSRAVSVGYIPATAVQLPPTGPLRGGPEVQVSVGDTMSVRTDLAPEWKPRFRVDPASGAILAIGAP